ncbi:hypothetical protein AA309_07035 [Microvirga vignae]|uniref:Uncharacterized protein n=1 Tax=Microvirga vignae TaxID=1225564 RepID=A0A0H1RF93_9HYPH|nr:DUF3800 domain-containing protein [Microvirga vignae]KLK93774.1 hypothetical protein AA309_07035 [Microvirga vignae]
MRVAPYACMAVAVHKPSLLLTDAFKKPYYLYFYIARLLLERVSWFCRFNKPADDPGNGKASFIFSSRRGLQVEGITEYPDLLRRKADSRSLYPDLAHNKIHWPALEREVELLQNKELIGLQLADAMASGLGKAIEPSQYYTTECRYIRHLKPIVFRRHKSYLSYGKILPAPHRQFARRRAL